MPDAATPTPEQPMDFLTIIEKALEGSEHEIESIRRRDNCEPDGEFGSVVVTLEDGRSFLVGFQRNYEA